MRLVSFCILLLTLTWSPHAHAQCTTLVPPGTISGETWNAAGSPYCLEGTILVNSLTIEPGVRVESLGEFFFIEVAGVLTAVGTESNPIVFTAAAELGGAPWSGVFFNNALPGSELAQVVIENAQNIALGIIGGSAPTIRDCRITNNVINGIGDGAGIFTDVPLTLTRCVIADNAIDVTNGTVRGAGIYSTADLVLIDSQVVRNTIFGSAPFSPSSAVVRGGGIYAAGNLTLERSVVDSNITDVFIAAGITSGESRGGGIYATGNVTIVNSFITRNAAIGTSFTSLTLGGGGLYLTGGGEVIHTTLAENTGEGLRSDGSTVTIVNSIAWENSDGQIVGATDTSFSDIQGGAPGAGNLDLNPLFLVPSPDDPGFDVHLDAVSPLIDQGTDAYPNLPNNDIDAEARPQQAGYDMGADEIPGVLAGPDLTVRVLAFTSTGFATDVDTTYQVDNVGDEAAGAFILRVLLLADGPPQLLLNQVVPSLAAGDAVQFLVEQQTAESLSDRRLIAFVDATNQVDEGDETNNLKRVTIP